MRTQKTFFKKDVSERQRDDLESHLNIPTTEPGQDIPRVSVALARLGVAQVEVSSERDTTRLLFISRDTTLLNQTTQSLDGYLNVADVFDEVHIVILQPGIRTRHPVLRIAPNVWVYIASARHWWGTPLAALRMIESQLMFADGFRADLVVARDPYESALIAYLVGKRYGRATQLHILENFTHPKVKAALPHSVVRTLLATSMIRRFASIRTITDTMLNLVTRRFSPLADIATLPRFRNYQALNQVAGSVHLKEKYTQFTFIIIYFGGLKEGRVTYQAIDAARTLLRNPKVGLVIVGEGELEAQLKRRVHLFGLKKQVVFERRVDDMAGYLSTADVLIVPDIDVNADDIAMAGAFAGVPLVLALTPTRSDVFTHGQSALFFGPGDVVAMTACLNQVLNDQAIRERFATAALQRVTKRLHEDPIVYKQAYRDSVEAALFISDSPRDL